MYSAYCQLKMFTSTFNTLPFRAFRDFANSYKKIFIPDMPFDTFEKTDYASLLKSIKEKLEKEEYLVTSTPNERKILRLGLCQIGSPLWPINHLPVFFSFLRALLRNSYATCMVTVPFHIYKVLETEDFFMFPKIYDLILLFFFQNNSIKEQCIHLSDICVHLQSFAGTPLEDNASLKDYNGFFQILKWAPINGLVNGGAQTDDLAVKLRRRKLVIEVCFIIVTVYMVLLLMA